MHRQVVLQKVKVNLFCLVDYYYFGGSYKKRQPTEMWKSGEEKSYKEYWRGIRNDFWLYHLRGSLV